MSRYVTLLRGVNVGRGRRIAMADLKELLAGLGYSDVLTYIVSGNAAFSSDEQNPRTLVRDIERALADRFGHDIRVVVRTTEQLAETTRHNPFLRAGVDPKTLHVVFLMQDCDASALDAIDPKHLAPDELVRRGHDVYCRLPNGVMASRLDQKFWSRHLSEPGTMRTWSTVTALLERATR